MTSHSRGPSARGQARILAAVTFAGTNAEKNYVWKLKYITRKEVCGGEGLKGRMKDKWRSVLHEWIITASRGFGFQLFLFNIEDLRRPSVRGAELSSVDRQANPSTA